MVIASKFLRRWCLEGDVGGHIYRGISCCRAVIFMTFCQAWALQTNTSLNTSMFLSFSVQLGWSCFSNPDFDSRPPVLFDTVSLPEEICLHCVALLHYPTCVVSPNWRPPKLIVALNSCGIAKCKLPTDDRTVVGLCHHWRLMVVGREHGSTPR